MTHTDALFDKHKPGGSLRSLRDYETRGERQRQVIHHYFSQFYFALVGAKQNLTLGLWHVRYYVWLRLLRLFAPASVPLYRPLIELRAVWDRHYSFTAEYARAHPDELTEYGRLTMIALPDLLDAALHELKKQQQL